MTDTVQVCIYGGGFTVLSALIKLVETRLARTQNKMIEKQDNLSVRLDGRMDELLELARRVAHADGMKEQKNLEENRDDNG